MLKGYKIIDVDGHVQEPADLWERYLEPAYRPMAPKVVNGKRFYKGVESSFKLADSVREIFQRKTLEHYEEYAKAGWSPESQVKAMDRMGLDVSYLFPTQGLFIWFFRNMEPDVAAAVVRAYNNWLHDFCSHSPERLKFVAGISLKDPELALMELRRVIKDFGCKEIFIRPNPENGRTLGNPAFEPLWAECERSGVALGVHEGAHAPMTTAGQDRFETDFALWSCSHPMEQMMAFLALLEGGVLERHPTLKVAFLEAGCGWMPYWLWRLDERYENVYPEVAQTIKMKPSEYFRRQCYVSLEADEPYIGDLVKYIGEDRVLFASDYPHPDHKPDLTNLIVGLEGAVSKRTLKKILWDNPRHFYGEA